MNRLLAAVILFALAESLFAAPPAPPTPASADRLVEQLGSEVFAEREAAMLALEKLGLAAKPALEAAARSTHPEICRRAGRVLAAIQRSADSHHLLAAKPVKLAYRNVALGTAVNDLKARTGINLVLDPANIADPLRRITCETGELPPWEAVAAFCQAAGLKEVFDVELPAPKPDRGQRSYPMTPPQPLPETVPVKLVDGKDTALPGNRSTAVRVVALPANFARNRVYLGSGDVLMHFDVAPLPGCHWQAVAGVRITKVVDDADRLGASGSSKEPTSGFSEVFDVQFALGGFGGDIEMPMRAASYPNPRTVPVPIRVNTPSARKLKMLEGAVICEISVPNQPMVTIDNIRTMTGIGVDGHRGMKLTVLDAKTGVKGGKSILKVQVDQPAPWLTQRGNPWGPNVMFELQAIPASTTLLKGYDAAGKPVRLSVLTNSGSSDEFTQTTSTQYICPDGLPVKLVLTGSKPVMVEVPFKMENVPLP
jgi:hypothetical protein